MKKNFFALFMLIALTMFSAGIAHAQSTPMPNTVDVVFDITQSPANVDFSATLLLSDGTADYDTQITVSAADSVAVASFKVPEFQTGKVFTLSVVSGFDEVQYYDSFYTQGDKIELQTYTYLENETPVNVSTFHLHAIPSEAKRVEFYRDYLPINLYPAPRYYDGVLYVPAAAGAKSMDISHIEYDNETGKITYWILETPITLCVGSKEVTAFGSTYTLEREVVTFDEIPYIPLTSFADIVGAWYLIQNEPDHINAVVSGSEAVKREIRNFERTQHVNTLDITSDTEYLIWVSKADYTLRVYKGSTHNWSLVKDITCAIGKTYTPTCVGTFKYYERVARWPYAKYYVGPIMRFNGGYAIHTTLIKYDGTPYDDRVGTNLSAGCVRLQPKDMHWLIDLIPMYTTVHITNY